MNPPQLPEKRPSPRTIRQSSELRESPSRQGLASEKQRRFESGEFFGSRMLAERWVLIDDRFRPLAQQPKPAARCTTIRWRPCTGETSGKRLPRSTSTNDRKRIHGR